MEREKQMNRGYHHGGSNGGGKNGKNAKGKKGDYKDKPRANEGHRSPSCRRDDRRDDRGSNKRR